MLLSFILFNILFLFISGASAPIDAANEAEVNTWLSLWQEKEGDLQETLADAQDAEDIIRDMDRLFAKAEKNGDHLLVARLQYVSSFLSLFSLLTKL